MAVRNWKTETTGLYFDPANWVEGVAPGLGDTTNIVGPSAPQFFPAGADPFFISPNPAPPGDTVRGEVINFSPPPSITAVIPVLSNTTFAADSVINISGPGTEQFSAWYSSNFAGVVNAGDATTPGSIELDLLSELGTTPFPTTTNTGVIAVAADSIFKIDPFVAMVQAPVNKVFTGATIFDNEGTIAVGPGGSLIESTTQTADSGDYLHTFVNNGLITFQGGANKSTIGLLETNLSGTGAIVLDGADSADPAWTQLRLTGNVTGGGIHLRNSSLRIESASQFGGPPHVTGGSIKFEDRNSFLLLQPIFATDFINPFSMPISGFRAGNTLAIGRLNLFGATYSLQWDQGAQILTIFEGMQVLARFTLLGNYLQADFSFIDNTFGTGAGAVHQNDNGTLSIPFQLDIITAATAQAAPS